MEPGVKSLIFSGAVLVLIGYLAVRYGHAITVFLLDPRFDAYPGFRLFLLVVGVPVVIGGLWAASLLFRVQRQ